MRDKYQDIIDEETIELAKKLAKLDRNLKVKLLLVCSIGIILSMVLFYFLVFKSSAIF